MALFYSSSLSWKVHFSYLINWISISNHANIPNIFLTPMLFPKQLFTQPAILEPATYLRTKFSRTSITKYGITQVSKTCRNAPFFHFNERFYNVLICYQFWYLRFYPLQGTLCSFFYNHLTIIFRQSPSEPFSKRTKFTHSECFLQFIWSFLIFHRWNFHETYDSVEPI